MTSTVSKDTLEFIHDDFHSAFSCCLDTIDDMSDVLEIAHKMAKDAISGPESGRVMALHKIERLIKLCRWHGDDTWHNATTVEETFREDHQASIVSAARANHVK